MKYIFITLSLLGLLIFASCKEKQQPAVDIEGFVVNNLTEQEFINKLTEKQANQTLKFKAEKPTIIDFYATWCGPCQKMAPNVAAIGKKYDGQIEVYKMDVDSCQSIATSLGIYQIPTLLYISPDGNVQLDNGYKEMDVLEETVKRNFSLKDN